MAVTFLMSMGIPAQTMEQNDWSLQTLFRTAWLACPRAVPALEHLLLFMNSDDRLIEHKITLKRTPCEEIFFPNGDHLPTFERSVRDRLVYIVQRFPQGLSPDQEFAVDMETVTLQNTISTARTCHARRVSVDIDWFPNQRSDKKFRGGQAVLAKEFIRNLDHAADNKADRIVTYDLHNPAITGFTDNFEMDELMAAPTLAIYLRYGIKGKKTVVSPDTGGAKRAEVMAGYLGAEMGFGYKIRKQGKEAKVQKLVIGDVKGCTAIVYDDIICTGGSTIQTVMKLYEIGAKNVVCVATHGAFTKESGKESPEEKFRQLSKQYGLQVIVTDTIMRDPQYLDANKDWLTVVTLAGHKSDFLLEHYLGGAVRDVFERYEVAARGELHYPDGHLVVPEGALSGMERRSIAYKNISDLLLNTKGYQQIWQAHLNVP